MTTIRSQPRGNGAARGSSATATLVSGPRVTSVTAPGGCARIVSTRTSTACPAPARDRAGRGPMSPIPSVPCTYCAGVQRLQEGRRASGVHRHSAAGEVARVERVLHRLVERHVAGDDGQREHLDVRVPQRHQQRDRVVGRGVGVDEEEAGGRHRGGGRFRTIGNPDGLCAALGCTATPGTGSSIRDRAGSGPSRSDSGRRRSSSTSTAAGCHSCRRSWPLLREPRRWGTTAWGCGSPAAGGAGRRAVAGLLGCGVALVRSP